MILAFSTVWSALPPEGLRYEADPRHGDLLSSSLNLTEASNASTPGVKPTGRDEFAEKTDELDTVDLLDYSGPDRIISAILKPSTEDFDRGGPAECEKRSVPEIWLGPHSANSQCIEYLACQSCIDKVEQSRIDNVGYQGCVDNAGSQNCINHDVEICKCVPSPKVEILFCRLRMSAAAQPQICTIMKNRMCKIS